MVEKISWFGHASVRIKSERIIYIDPWKIKGSEKADLILITHSHYDHLSPGDVKTLQKKETIILATPDCVSQLAGDVRAVKPGDRLTVLGIEVEVVPSYNLKKAFHPKGNNWVGYVVIVEGNRIYYPGDTDFIPEMKNIRADIIILPVGGTYTMDAREAAEAVNTMKHKVAVPIHYGDIVGSLKDAQIFKELAEIPVEIIPVVPS
ncbi:MAG: MBL fold metallo-hydrolase [Deltaproteobacteria bacterium]|nr:MBL fold metallo-hydrolase [Deltaproteobacteria bacterium]